MRKPLELLKNLQPKLDGVLKYSIAASLMAVPLYAKFPFARIPGTFVSIRLEDFLIGFLAILFLVYVLPDLSEFLKDKLNWSIILYLLIGLASVFWAIFVTKTVPIHIGILHWVRRVEYFIPFFVGVAAIRRHPEYLSFFIKTLFLVVLLAFIYGMGQKYLTWPIIVTQNAEYAKGVALTWIPGSHISSTFAGHYDLATFLVLVLPIIIPSIFVFKRMMNRFVFLLISLGGLWLLANTASRISIVSYMVSVTLALFLLKRFRAIFVVIIVSMVFFSLTSSVVTRYTRVFDVLRDRVQIQVTYVQDKADISVLAVESTPPPDSKIEDQQPSPQPEDRSSSIRFNVEWPRAIRAFSKNPLLGTGYSSITLATDNDYLRALGETGLLGLLAFGLIFVRIIIAYISKFPFSGHRGLEKVVIIGTFAALPGIFMNAVFIDVFEASKFAILFWFVMGFVVAILDNSTRLKRTK